LSANPPPWPVLRAAVRPILPARSRAPRPRWLAWWPWIRAGLIWFFTRPQAWWQGVPAWRFTLEVGGAVLALIGLVAFLLDLQNREEERVNRAWSLVAAAKVEGTGNVGLIEALETLASRGIDLSQVKLPGAYLVRVRLRGAMLYMANLSEANLRRAVLNQAKLGDADLRGADLHWADLSDADLVGADLRKASLVVADLRGANLIKAKLGDADLRGVDLIGAYLLGADLSDADLVGADLSDADLSNAKLGTVNLSEAKLVGADLRGADLSQVELLEADLSEAKLDRVDLTGLRFCRTTMPDGSVCNRDCKVGDDRSCPFLGSQTPEQQAPQGLPNPPSLGQMGGTKDPGR
jgi:uncharacterized protein YjbI with pentapeptide repeats